MKTISSQAGTRLARAKAELDEWKQGNGYGTVTSRGVMLRGEYKDAAEEVANELIAQGFHLMEGN